jgi:hypothetical protein
MSQHPKFIISNNDGIITWRCEKDNAEISGTSGEETFGDKVWAEETIKDHIAAVIGASGVSISLGTEFQPVTDYEGFDEDLSPPPPEGPIDEETVEPESDPDEG